MRAPLGNSIRTLLLFGLLVAIGIVVWWIRRPADLTTQLGGREWAIVEVDGEPAVNRVGTVSTFVLDGTGEVRGVIECNVASGSWSYDTRGRRLDLQWQQQTLAGCSDDWPATYLPTAGVVDLGGGALRIESDTVEVSALALADHESVAIEDLQGSWLAGEQPVEIAERGLFDVGACRGSWTADPTEPPAFVVDFDDPESDECQLVPAWLEDAAFVAVEHAGTVFLRHDRTAFPLDRSIVRLDRENVAGTPIAP